MTYLTCFLHYSQSFSNSMRDSFSTCFFFYWPIFLIKTLNFKNLRDSLESLPIDMLLEKVKKEKKSISLFCESRHFQSIR